MIAPLCLRVFLAGLILPTSILAISQEQQIVLSSPDELPQSAYASQTTQAQLRQSCTKQALSVTSPECFCSEITSFQKSSSKQTLIHSYINQWPARNVINAVKNCAQTIINKSAPMNANSKFPEIVKKEEIISHQSLLILRASLGPVPLTIKMGKSRNDS
jgi:hypothetical protein